MRSVAFHLVGATHAQVGEWLTTVAKVTLSESWNWSLDSSETVLLAAFYRDLEIEAEPDALEELRAALGKLPDVSVIVDVPGRFPGDGEVREFAGLILNRFRGVATDDYTSHGWTLQEIRGDAQVQGHPFFDYKGWVS